MNDEIALLGLLVAKLDAAGIPYMLSGSLASSVWGEPRTSYDVDLVIAPTVEQLRAFVESLGNAFYVSAGAAEEAFKTHGTFNVIESRSGLKADLIIRKERPFSIEEFERRRTGRLGGVEVVLVSPEDSLLSKLEWARESGSERQFRDALGVAELQHGHLDTDYLRRWADDLGVSDLLERLLDEAKRTG